MLMFCYDCCPCVTLFVLFPFAFVYACIPSHTCYQIMRHKLKSVVVIAPQAEERRGKCTWRTLKMQKKNARHKNTRTTHKIHTWQTHTRTCYQTLRDELKSVVVRAPQAEEGRCKYTWRTISLFFKAGSLLLHWCSSAWITLHHKLKSVVVKRAKWHLRDRTGSPSARRRVGRKTLHHELKSVVVKLDGDLYCLFGKAPRELEAG